MNCRRHLSGLAGTVAHFAFTITGNDNGGKGKVLTTLDNLGYPVDVDDCFCLFSLSVDHHRIP